MHIPLQQGTMDNRKGRPNGRAVATRIRQCLAMICGDGIKLSGGSLLTRCCSLEYRYEVEYHPCQHDSYPQSQFNAIDGGRSGIDRFRQYWQESMIVCLLLLLTDRNQAGQIAHGVEYDKTPADPSD